MKRKIIIENSISCPNCGLLATTKIKDKEWAHYFVNFIKRHLENKDCTPKEYESVEIDEELWNATKNKIL